MVQFVTCPPPRPSYQYAGVPPWHPDFAPAVGVMSVENFLHLGADECALIRSRYDAALAAKRIRPRGATTTDVDARLVLGDLPLFDFLVAETIWRLEETYGYRLRLKPDYVAYTRATVGGRHPLHADGVKLDGSPNHTPRRVASAMLYLSDGGADFDGGALRFSKLGVEITPRPGLLVGFLCGLDYQHEVTVVTRGVRDAVAMWFHRGG